MSPGPVITVGRRRKLIIPRKDKYKANGTQAMAKGTDSMFTARVNQESGLTDGNIGLTMTHDEIRMTN
jgi:hypothetical protein